MTHTAPLLIVRVSSLPFETLAPLTAARSVAIADQAAASRAKREELAERASKLLYAAAGVTAPPDLAAARVALLGIRRSLHRGGAADPAALERARPLLTGEALRVIAEHDREQERSASLERDLEETLAAEEARGRAALAEASRNPWVRLGLRLASRSLLGRAAGLEASRWGQRERHAASKVLAYLARFATKTSPNGVFCATALGSLADEGTAVDGENRIERLDVALHVGEARKVAAVLASSPEAAPAIRPRANPTLRAKDGGWTLWQPASPRRESDEETRLEIKAHPVLRRFIEAADGSRTAEELVAAAGAEAGQDVWPFYANLVERGIVIGEVEIPWSERRPLRALAARCAQAPWAAELESIEADVDAMAALAPDAPDAVPERIDAVTARLAALPRARPLTEDDAVRCDAATALRVRLPRTLLADLERLLPRYARFYGAIYPERLTRETFANRFLKRYPPDTPVPVLDFYHGLFEPGPARPLAAFASAAAGPADSPRRAEAGRAFERARDLFARRAREAAEAGSDEAALTEEDWASIAGDGAAPRFSCAALFQVDAESAGQVGSANARLYLNAIFPGAGLSVARLAHLHRETSGPNPIELALREGWSRRARPGAAFAEITFMHGGRTANAGLRPPLFPLEIELPGDRATAGREAVPLADLVAAWDSAAERFTLRSISRGIEILPVISSGINPEGFVQFLTMIGEQGLQPLGLLPGFDHSEIRAWPRFRSGNVVLFRKRWVFSEAEMPRGATPAARFLAARRWVREHGLPEHVFVHSEREPKPFYMNLGSPAFLDLMHRGLEGAGRVHVTEMAPGPEGLWVRDARGRYASEFLVHVDHLGPGTAS